jgi:hypothetical protein
MSLFGGQKRTSAHTDSGARSGQAIRPNGITPPHSHSSFNLTLLTVVYVAKREH